MSKRKLQPNEIELEWKKCKHVLELVSSTEAKCKKCGAGWMGKDIVRLVKSN